jgi:hypothetical protein
MVKMNQMSPGKDILVILFGRKPPFGCQELSRLSAKLGQRPTGVDEAELSEPVPIDRWGAASHTPIGADQCRTDDAVFTVTMELNKQPGQ